MFTKIISYFSRKTCKRNLQVVCVLFLFTAFVGCNGRYQWGNPGTMEFTTIYVLPIANESFAPQAQIVLAGQIRDFIIRDGRLRLVNSAADADALLQVKIADYRRTGSSRDPNDTTRVLTNDLQLEATVSLLKGDSNETWFRDLKVAASSSVYSANLFAAPGSIADLRQDSLEAEFQEMPNLTRELARRIADAVLNVW
jgi:hypothetical protein